MTHYIRKSFEAGRVFEPGDTYRTSKQETLILLERLQWISDRLSSWLVRKEGSPWKFPVQLEEDFAAWKRQ